MRKEGRSAFYSLGKKMTRIASNIVWSFQIPDWSCWENTWWGITFSIPESEKPLRHQIRKKLAFYRFAPFSGGFWIRPFHKDENMDEKFKSLRLSNTCRMIKFSYIDAFSADDAAGLWKLKNINTDFDAGINLISHHSKKVGEMTPEEAFRLRIELGNTIIPQLALDPLLPESLLPENWLGRKIRELFFHCDEQLKIKSKLFWKNMPE